MSAEILLKDQNATGAGDAVSGPQGMDRQYQVWGKTESGSGSATVTISGSNNGGVSWDTLGTVTLTLGTTATSDGFSSRDRYTKLRGNVTAISGTGARVSAAFSY